MQNRRPLDPNPIPPSDWPDDLDAMIAAPAYHSVMLENDAVRVLDTTVPPGHTVPLHTHRWPAVHYILTWSDFIRRDHTGTILLDTRSSPQHPPHGTATWSEPLAPHTLENVGESSLRVVSVELKNPTQPINLSSPTQFDENPSHEWLWSVKLGTITSVLPTMHP